MHPRYIEQARNAILDRAGEVESSARPIGAKTLADIHIGIESMTARGTYDLCTKRSGRALILPKNLSQGSRNQQQQMMLHNRYLLL